MAGRQLCRDWGVPVNNELNMNQQYTLREIKSNLHTGSWITEKAEGVGFIQPGKEKVEGVPLQKGHDKDRAMPLSEKPTGTFAMQETLIG